MALDAPVPLTEDVVFAESPRWHDGRLWFSDVHDYALKSVDLSGAVRRVAELPGRPAGMGFMPDGRLLVATALDRKLNWVSADGSVREACDLTELAAGTLNDMVVDGHGRAYVGDIGFNQSAGEPPRPGQVILFTEEDGARRAAADVVFPNGCAVDASATHYYVCETLAQRVTRFRIEEDGRLVDRELVAALDSPPDGLCLDSDGGIWIAQPLAGRFAHLAGDGSVDDVIGSQAPFAVSCVLGGEGRRSLFLSSAETDLTRLARGDSSGRIDVARVIHPGAGWP